MTPRPCPRCAAPLVALSSRRRGLCAGCVIELDTKPAGSGTVEHRADCTSPAVVEHTTARRRVTVCHTCGAWLVLPLVARWGVPS